MHIPDREKCNWLRERIETPAEAVFTPQKKRHTLDRLAWSEMFETFCANKWGFGLVWGVCCLFGGGFLGGLDWLATSGVLPSLLLFLWVFVSCTWGGGAGEMFETFPNRARGFSGLFGRRRGRPLVAAAAHGAPKPQAKAPTSARHPQPMIPPPKPPPPKVHGRQALWPGGV
jgi:hypothetical protein